jgi:hypothetical protein
MALKEHFGYIIIVLFVGIYLGVTVYLKHKLKFWITQPVFHIYNIWYWINPPGVITKELPSIVSVTQKGASKHLNQYNIKTLEVEELKDTVLCAQICNFIKTNYIFQEIVPKQHKREGAQAGAAGKAALEEKKAVKTEYTPTQSNIIEYHNGTNHPSFFSIYQQPKILFEKGEAATTVKDLIGVISARALTICLKNTLPFQTYYIDNLCVDPLNRKNGIAPQLIQTQCYNLRHLNTKIQTCLFKREGQLNALVPLVVFETYCLDLSSLKKEAPVKEMREFTVIEIGVPQLPLFIDFIKAQKPDYECMVLPEIANLIHLLKSENLVIYALLDRKGQIQASFTFRRLNLTYDGKKAMECINVVVLKDINPLYKKGFSIILTTLKKKNPFEYLLIEETANAKQVIDYLIYNIKASIYFKSPTAFFLYNYACRTISSGAAALFIY